MKSSKKVTEVDDTGIQTLKGMYKDYFLDYASYVILERAVPATDDGLKPVQRRILHSMWEKDDGRYHKVANIIGHTMQYHPHGDAAIGDALVNLGQKDLMIDTQGNWGDIRTGDKAAAPRYIEARLTKFAIEVGFNPQTTDWQLSYDGRNKEPLALPMKFPLVLAQGAEGIAVGLSTRIMPHNFIELLDASIKYLQDKRFKLYPDFPNGGLVDASDYNGGKRGGKLRVRARIEMVDKKTLAIREIPYGQTTSSIIDSIIKANDQGKIKIKKLTDNTAKDVEILIELASGVSPEVTMDALYAFTSCENSISPNACVIIDNKPHFLGAEEILKLSADRTRELLKLELEIKKKALEDKWHFASLEKIFIEKRIYRDIEECESWEEVLETIAAGLDKYVCTPSTEKKGDKRIRIYRDITTEDIARLTEIKIKRISKYNVFKADELIKSIEDELEQVKYDLAHLTDFTIAYFQNLIDKYGKGKERKSELVQFDSINATHVIANNAKLYVNRAEGFAGFGMKKDEFIRECSNLDDIIAFRKDGKFIVSRISEKGFMGKKILHIDVWKKGDDRTTYNMIYVDGKTGRAMAKRFNVKSITREREYDLTTGEKGSKVLYFAAHPNGESETVEIHLTPGSSARKKIFTFDFADLDIKGRSSKGNIVTKYPVRKVVQQEVGKSTLGAIDIWMDEVSGRLNKEERGRFLGSFDTGDQILAIHADGTYELADVDPQTRFDTAGIKWVGKYREDAPISAVYYEGEKGWTMVKRFFIETSKVGQRYKFITEHRSSKVNFASTADEPVVEYSYKANNKKQVGELDICQFIDIKGWKALGNKLMDKKILTIQEKSAASSNGAAKPVKEKEDPQPEVKEEPKATKPKAAKTPAKRKSTRKPPAAPELFDSADEDSDDQDKFTTGDTIEFDV